MHRASDVSCNFLNLFGAGRLFVELSGMETYHQEETLQRRHSKNLTHECIPGSAQDFISSKAGNQLDKNTTGKPLYARCLLIHLLHLGYFIEQNACLGYSIYGM